MKAQRRKSRQCRCGALLKGNTLVAGSTYLSESGYVAVTTRTCKSCKRPAYRREQAL